MSGSVDVQIQVFSSTVGVAVTHAKKELVGYGE